ncbi:hypothetical protein SS50377_25742 [Spironucleus salmonicida]|uniref:Leucine rich repeats-containing protein n=1 Tax=Spironucleus salmonicida TaxID=348837 RepID=V6LX43_9EUKA|nr:hypothetical protein SS50377_25737 [Spironucleus salmonicida]KAH0571554.1 hypothetical protein SS50377_25742 [Spironucleus salmonicida]|eukprot:EST47572.1 Hypothetical protein SS50377_12365 [Spironucleus salmonicida]
MHPFEVRCENSPLDSLPLEGTAGAESITSINLVNVRIGPLDLRPFRSLARLRATGSTLTIASSFLPFSLQEVELGPCDLRFVDFRLLARLRDFSSEGNPVFVKDGAVPAGVVCMSIRSAGTVTLDLRAAGSLAHLDLSSNEAVSVRAVPQSLRSLAVCNVGLLGIDLSHSLIEDLDLSDTGLTAPPFLPQTLVRMRCSGTVPGLVVAGQRHLQELDVSYSADVHLDLRASRRLRTLNIEGAEVEFAHGHIPGNLTTLLRYLGREEAFAPSTGFGHLMEMPDLYRRLVARGK